MIRYMMKEDYPEVRNLWERTEGFHIRKKDDSERKIHEMLARNPHMSVVAQVEGKIVGNVLCGHDGRSGMLYHVCVDEAYQRKGIGTAMVEMAVRSLKREGIGTVLLIAFIDNETGNRFWNKINWHVRKDINFYEYIIDSANTAEIVVKRSHRFQAAEK